MNKQNKISDLGEFKKMAPTLSSLKKENHFSVPSNYFDEFPMKVKSKIDAEENASSSFSFAWLFNYKVLTPIGVCAIIILGTLLLNNPAENLTLEELTAYEIEESLEYYGYPSVDDEFLAVLYSEENKDSEDQEKLSEEEIVNYLLEEEVDVSQLYYEL